MKRCIIIWIFAALLISGCGQYTQLRDPITFYYVRKDYSSDMQSILGSEEWESPEDRNLQHLLALYLMGPTRDDLVSLLPNATKVLSLEQSEQHIFLTLSDASLSESDFTLVCACLAQTLLNLTDAQQITVTCASRSMTLRLEDVTLFDTLWETK